MYTGIISEKDHQLEMMFLCIQTCDVYGAPHEILLKVNIVDKVKELSCKCSCKAGLSGKCKHIVAELIHLARLGYHCEHMI